MHRIALAAAAMLALAASASAQQPSQAQANAVRQACRSDYQAHCMGVPTGGSEALACLRNAQGLSAACRRAVDAVGSATSAPAPAGKPAAPATSAPVPGRAAATPPAMAPMPQREGAMPVREACAGDYRHFCRGLPPGGGRVLACLREKADGLSQQCRHALAALR